MARVLVDTGLPHLDRPFEYAVPPALAQSAVPGVRVKVRFAGRDVAGYVMERCAAAEHEGRLTPLRTVVSPEPVLTPPILRLAQELAVAYAGTVADVLRLAIPPRHARAERALAPGPSADNGSDAEDGTADGPATHAADEPVAAIAEGPAATASGPGLASCWSRRAAASSGEAWAAYPAGPALLRRLAAGQAPIAVWTALPAGGDLARDWPRALAEAAAATQTGGRGALLVVPDGRDLDRLDAAMAAVLGPGKHVRLSAEQGPQARYTAWLKVLRGQVRVAIGTRAAAYAPVRDLGLIAVWDDGDDLHAEPRAPYPHVPDIALRRAAIEGAGMLLGGYGRSVWAQQLVATGAAREVAASAGATRAAAPRVLVAGEDREQERDAAATNARLPSLAWRTASAALKLGPVLVQVPRRGYIPAVACQTCRARARCARCQGPLELGGDGVAPRCRWCATPALRWVCPVCGETRLRSLVIGARRTAEELGRAFPGVAVITSGADQVRADVPGTPALVIATPGAEPVAEGGYAAALLLDAWALLDRPDLDCAPEALRRWLAAAALVRPATAGGAVVLCGVAPGVVLPPVEALVRWDPGWLAARELADRTELALPPVTTLAAVTGSRGALEALAADPRLPPTIERYGVTPGRHTDEHRLILKAAPGDALGLGGVLAAERAARSARKDPDQIAVRLGVTDLS